MPLIKAKVVPVERKALEAQGRLSSAKSTRNPSTVAPVVKRMQQTASSDDSATSSDSDSSMNRPVSAKAKKAFVDPEDHSLYAKRSARQEWLYATGQSGAVPSPPPKAAAKATGGLPQSPAAQSVANRSTATKSAASPASPPPAPALGGSVSPQKINEQSPQRTDVSSAAVPSAAVHSTPPKPMAEQPAKDSAQGGSTPSTAEPVSEAARVTDEEERVNPGRRDFLKLLDILGDEKPISESAKRASAKMEQDALRQEEERRNAEAKEQSKRREIAATMNVAQLTEHYFDQMYKEWLESDADKTFMALEQWNKAEAMAILDKANTFDPSELHQALRQTVNSSEARAETLNRTLRFNDAVTRLEQYVVSDGFVRRVNQFLQRHHQTFLKSKAARDRGEYSHSDHTVWTQYCALMEQLVVGELKRNVTDFDEEEFFQKIFESSASEEADDTATADNSSSSAFGSLSYAAWEVLLSFLRFEHFCSVMDEFIDVHYGVDKGAESSGARGLVGSLRKSPPPSAQSSDAGASNRSATSQRGSVATAAPVVGKTAPTGSKPTGGHRVQATGKGGK